MMEAAGSGKLKALYVVGANPVKTFGAKQADKLGGLDLLVVHDLFLTETAQARRRRSPGRIDLRKRRHGDQHRRAKLQMTHRSIDPQGPRSDFDLLRILSHQLAQLGMGPAIRLRTPEAALDEIRQNVPGYRVSLANLLAGGAERTAAAPQAVEESDSAPAGAIFSSQDYALHQWHAGPLLLQAQFLQRGQREAVEFVAQHPVLVVSLVKIVVLLFVLMTALAYLTWFERKVVAHIQSRWGPLYVGAHGLLQPLADGVKFLFKEDVTPPAADRFVYVFAPFLALSLALATIALIPFGPATIMILGVPTQLAIANVSLGLLFLFAITSMGVYGVALAGWSSNSKYPLLGGLRSSAQMVSYEVSLTLSVVGVVAAGRHAQFQRADHQSERPLVCTSFRTGT